MTFGNGNRWAGLYLTKSFNLVHLTVDWRVDLVLPVHSAPGALHSLLGPGLCQLLSGTRTQNVELEELEELEYQIRKRFITFWNSMKNMKMTSYSQNADDFTSVSCQIAVLLGFKRSQILCDFFISFHDFA